MKKILFCLGLLSLVGCVVPPVPIAFINQATWPNATKDKVYTACLTSLQLQNFNIHPAGTSKESGLIIAERDPFALAGYDTRVEGLYRLQIMVSEISDNKIMVDINVKASYRDKEEGLWGGSAEYERNAVNNQLAADMEELFNQMERLVGGTPYYRRVTLSWK